MRVLLDECVPKRLGRKIRWHEVRTVQQMGWAGIKNGELLRRAAANFDAFVTVDQGIPFQQRIEALAITVVVLRARSNDIDDLVPLAPRILDALGAAEPGTVIELSAQ